MAFWRRKVRVCLDTILSIEMGAPHTGLSSTLSCKLHESRHIFDLYSRIMWCSYVALFLVYVNYTWCTFDVRLTYTWRTYGQIHIIHKLLLRYTWHTLDVHLTYTWRTYGQLYYSWTTLGVHLTHPWRTYGHSSIIHKLQLTYIWSYPYYS